MEIEITEKKDNALLDRVDVHFVATHAGEKTPTRDQVRKAVAAAVGAKTELTVVALIEPHYGQGASTGFAKVYQDLAKARHHERDYMLKRNGLFEEPKKEES